MANLLKQKRAGKRIFTTNKSISYVIFMVSVMTILMLMFMSKSFFPYSAVLFETSIGAAVEVDTQTSITIRRWDYSLSDGRMEIELFIDDIYNAYKTKFLITARTRVKATLLPAEIVYKNDEYMIVEITNISSGFEAVSLTVSQLDNEDNIKSDSKNIRLYCDERTVNRVDKIAQKTETEYAIFIAEENIKNILLEISKTEKQIADLNAEITILRSDISTLKDKLKYQTDTEYSKTESVIKQKEQGIEEKEKQISDFRELLKEQREKHKKLNEILQDIR